MTKHTELPWKMEEQNVHTGSICTCHGDKDTWFEVWTPNWADGVDAEANAAFIVKACNNYYQLVETLENIIAESENHNASPDTMSDAIEWMKQAAREAIKQAEQ